MTVRIQTKRPVHQGTSLHRVATLLLRPRPKVDGHYRNLNRRGDLQLTVWVPCRGPLTVPLPAQPSPLRRPCFPLPPGESEPAPHLMRGVGASWVRPAAPGSIQSSALGAGFHHTRLACCPAGSLLLPFTAFGSIRLSLRNRVRPRRPACQAGYDRMGTGPGQSH